MRIRTQGWFEQDYISVSNIQSEKKIAELE